MIRIVTRKEYFLPVLSPKYPKSNAPKGRIARPDARVNKAMTKAGPGGRDEKKCLAILDAKDAYREKSYHSKIVPRLDATITRIWFEERDLFSDMVLTAIRF